MGRILGKMYYCCTFYNIIHALSCQSKFVSIHFTYKLSLPIISGEHLTDCSHSKFNLEHNTLEELSKIFAKLYFFTWIQHLPLCEVFLRHFQLIRFVLSSFHMIVYSGKTSFAKSSAIQTFSVITKAFGTLPTCQFSANNALSGCWKKGILSVK